MLKQKSYSTIADIHKKNWAFWTAVRRQKYTSIRFKNMHGFRIVLESIFVTRSSRTQLIGVKANITRTCVVFMLHSKVKTIIFTWFTDNQDWQHCCSCSLLLQILSPTLYNSTWWLHATSLQHPFSKIIFSQGTKKSRISSCAPFYL